ncbi:MAG: gluconate 2-dehydrogenase subunit 3 family protein [Saprospiraceae bacterium]
MDRRKTLKSMLVGGIAGPLMLAGCQQEEDKTKQANSTYLGPYGRTDKEKEHDAKVMAASFFSEHELATIAVLCDLILPATSAAVSATQAGVPEFISFIVKDLPDHQVPLRGGMMWLDHRSKKLFGKVFMMSTPDQQKQMLDEIAWPDQSSPEVEQGVAFFSLIRNLVMTGYYTSKEGLKDLGYQGNVANVWDGVPADVLAKHNLSYDPVWIAKCVDQNKRDVLAEWDAEGNLIS